MFLFVIMAIIMAWKYEWAFRWFVLSPFIGTILGAFVWTIACLMTSTFLDVRALGVLIIACTVTVGIVADDA